MRKWLLDLQWLSIFVAVWIILFGQLTPLHVGSGILVGLFSLVFTEKFLIGSSYYHHYPINIVRLSSYFIYLLIEIYAAGFSTIRLIITGDINPRIIKIKTDLEDDYSISLLANSITLTPGTVTVDVEGQELSVLWLNAVTKDSKKAGKLIKGNLEAKLRAGGRK